MQNNMEFGKLNVKEFNLKHTFESAQPLTFHADFNDISNTLTYFSKDRPINIRFEGNTRNGNIVIASYDIGYAINDVSRRFRINDDMRKVYKNINTDKFMEEAIESYRGMRLTLNDPWEATLVFIISQFNNVKRIRGITKKLIENFGEQITDEYGKPLGKAFPSSRILANASEKDIAKCGAGFRARYIKRASEYCTHNIDLSGLSRKPYGEIKESLMEIDGIGGKVADCIALMGYGKLEAFPIDTWVQRTLSKVYFKGKNTNIKKLQEFATDRWGKYSGYAQQYLFWYGRDIGRLNGN